MRCDDIYVIKVSWKNNRLSFRGTGPVATDVSLPLVVKINIVAEVS
jgi:hypothetical protein